MSSHQVLLFSQHHWASRKAVEGLLCPPISPPEFRVVCSTYVIIMTIVNETLTCISHLVVFGNIFQPCLLVNSPTARTGRLSISIPVSIAILMQLQTLLALEYKKTTQRYRGSANLDQVFISYATQMGLALVAFALAMPWKNVAHSIRNVTMALWRRLRPGKETHSKAMGLPVTKLAQQESDKGDADHTLKFDPASAIIPAVVEFQKAQCYFMLATNIASIIVQIKGGLDPESFQQLYNTYIFIKVIAIGGYLPITFGLLTLRMLNKVGWYLLALSIASVGVAIPNLYIKRSFSPTLTDFGDLQTQSVQNGPTSCGGNNPIAWCYKPIGVNSYGFRATNTVDGADDILAACLVTLALLIIEHFWNSPDRTNRSIRKTIFRSSLSGLKADRFRRLRPVTRWLWRYIVPAFFTLLVLIHLYCFAVFAEDLDWFRLNKIYDPSWGFGQIVAVLIWAPPLCEYFWETFRKYLYAAPWRDGSGVPC